MSFDCSYVVTKTFLGNLDEEKPPPPLPKNHINADENIIYTNSPNLMEPLKVGFAVVKHKDRIT